jgi:hypothetical protein
VHTRLPVNCPGLPGILNNKNGAGFYALCRARVRRIASDSQAFMEYEADVGECAPDMRPTSGWAGRQYAEGGGWNGGSFPLAHKNGGLLG